MWGCSLDGLKRLVCNQKTESSSLSSSTTFWRYLPGLLVRRKRRPAQKWYDENGEAFIDGPFVYRFRTPGSQLGKKGSTPLWATIIFSGSVRSSEARVTDDVDSLVRPSPFHRVATKARASSQLAQSRVRTPSESLLFTCRGVHGSSVKNRAPAPS